MKDSGSAHINFNDICSMRERIALYRKHGVPLGNALSDSISLLDPNPIPHPDYDYVRHERPGIDGFLLEWRRKSDNP